MREALQEVKEKLGADAVILSTRSVREKGKGGIPIGQPMIEVTACPSPAAKGKRPSAPGTASPTSNTPGTNTSGGFSVVVDDHIPTPSPVSPSASADPAIHLPRTTTMGRTTAETVMERPQVRPKIGGGMLRDLTDIRKRLEELEGQRDRNSPANLDKAGLDAEGKKSYGWLLMHGVEEPLALKLAQVDRAAKNRGLEMALSRVLQFRDPLTGDTEEEPRVIALVGPTGVGKTTTLAKVAAELLLNRQKPVGMITLDTFRVGAVAQLETYAKLLQVRLVVARNKSEVQAGLHSLQRCQYILVDTVGSSPYNRRQVESTGELLPLMGKNREVLLCMAGNVRETEQQAIYRRFATLGLTGLTFTKLDETLTYGGILNVALRARLPLTFYTDGQRVPENLGWLSAEVMAKWFNQGFNQGKEGGEIPES